MKTGCQRACEQLGKDTGAKGTPMHGHQITMVCSLKKWGLQGLVREDVVCGEWVCLQDLSLFQHALLIKLHTPWACSEIMLFVKSKAYETLRRVKRHSGILRATWSLYILLGSYFSALYWFLSAFASPSTVVLNHFRLKEPLIRLQTCLRKRQLLVYTSFLSTEK